MRKTMLAASCAAVALLVASCGQEASPTVVIPTSTRAPTATQSLPTPQPGQVIIKSKQRAPYGTYLSDVNGRAVYLFTRDQRGGGTTACTGACAQMWPHVVTKGAPLPGDGIIPSLLGTIRLADGTTGVTYNGWPLHYYSKDVDVREAEGQGLEGVWFLVSPNGEPVPPPVAPPTPTPRA